jgi:hypothetical protein
MDTVDDTLLEQVTNELFSYLCGICPVLLSVESNFFSSTIHSSKNKDIISKFAQTNENMSLLVAISSDGASGEIVR